jgi:hypothetical protein
MPRYRRTSRVNLSCHPNDVGRKSGLESPPALRQRRIIPRLEAATSIPSPIRIQCLRAYCFFAVTVPGKWTILAESE